MDGIFISYRRDDSAGYAGRLHDRLAAHFGAERVFMDVEGIEPGVDFVDAIEQAVSSCRVLIVMIGDEWATATDASGRRRLDDPKDFVRLETAAALQRGIRVVPVLVGHAVMPQAALLPDELKPLTRRQAIEVMHKQWEASTGELIRTLERILGADAAGGAPLSLSSAASSVPAPSALAQPGSASPSPASPAAPSAPPPSTVPAVDEASIRSPHDVVAADWPSRRLPMLLAVSVVAAIGASAAWWLWASNDMVDGDKVLSDAASPGAVQHERTVPPVAANARSESPSTEAPSVPARSSAPPALPSPAPATRAPPAQPATQFKPAAPPAAIEPPAILAFDAEAGQASVQLCYRVRGAESVTLAPRPGSLARADRDCVRVPLDKNTRFTLVARSAGASVQRTLDVAPQVAAASVPAPAAPPIAPHVAPPPVAGAALPRPPTVESGAGGTAVDTARPRVGESWVYRRSGKWLTSPRGTYTLTVQSVSGSTVSEQLRPGPDAVGVSAEDRRFGAAGAGFVQWSGLGIEFNPYLVAFGRPEALASASGFATPDVGSQWMQWHSRMTVHGREAVSVPAGRFDALKVEVWSTRTGSGSLGSAHLEPVRMHYVVWYERGAKRYVKMRRTVTSAGSSVIDDDVFELVEHRR